MVDVNKAMQILKFTVLNVEWQVGYEETKQDGKSATDFEARRSEKVRKPSIGITDKN
jgi:hypothetical protein